MLTWHDLFRLLDLGGTQFGGASAQLFSRNAYLDRSIDLGIEPKVRGGALVRTGDRRPVPSPDNLVAAVHAQIETRHAGEPVSPDFVGSPGSLCFNQQQHNAAVLFQFRRLRARISASSSATMNRRELKC